MYHILPQLSGMLSTMASRRGTLHILLEDGDHVLASVESKAGVVSWPGVAVAFDGAQLHRHAAVAAVVAFAFRAPDIAHRHSRGFAAVQLCRAVDGLLGAGGEGARVVRDGAVGCAMGVHDGGAGADVVALLAAGESSHDTVHSCFCRP